MQMSDLVWHYLIYKFTHLHTFPEEKSECQVENPCLILLIYIKGFYRGDYGSLFKYENPANNQ